MANEMQFRATTRIIATWGTTTAVLARYAAHVIGTDISPKCVGRARAMRPGLDFRVLDAFDVRSVLELGVPITKVYMDLSGLSGYRGLLDLIALIQVYAGLVRPDTVVVKSGALKHFAQCCSPWHGAPPLTGKAGGSQPDGELPPPNDAPHLRQQEGSRTKLKI